MWVFTSKGFISAVAHRDKPDHLMVRARRLEHLQAILPGQEVQQIASSDYKYRVTVSKDTFAGLMFQEITRLTYDNFKNSIPDAEYHDACSQVWRTMHTLQPGSHMPKYHADMFADDDDDDEPLLDNDGWPIFGDPDKYDDRLPGGLS